MRCLPESYLSPFVTIRVIVHPAKEAKVNVKYWDTASNTVFHESVLNLGQLAVGEIKETTPHITDWDGYTYRQWNVALPDGTLQYEGTERDVHIILDESNPEKNLSVEFTPLKEAKVNIRYWDTSTKTVFHESILNPGTMAEGEEKTADVHITDWDGYE